MLREDVGVVDEVVVENDVLDACSIEVGPRSEEGIRELEEDGASSQASDVNQLCNGTDVPEVRVSLRSFRARDRMTYVKLLLDVQV